MSVSPWGERPNSLRSATNPRSITLGYVLTGTANETIARALAGGYAPVLYAGLYRQNIALDRQGPDFWHVDVTWGPYEKKEPEVGDFKWGFTTGGGTYHTTQAISHVNSYVKSGGTAVNHYGAIGVTESGDVDGVDVPDVAFEWTEERKLSLGSYGWSYAQIVGGLTLRVNNATFRGLPIGSVLFKGADGTFSLKDPTLLEMTYRFAYSPNIDDWSIGSGGNAISGIDKKGWEYLWVEYRDAEGEAGSDRLKKIPIQVNVEQVFYAGDFSLLGIGTT